MAGPNIRIAGWQPDEIVQQLLGRAKAFVHVAEEEFGIAMVEAQAAGCPVIAFGKGGAAETVVDGETGLLFHEQSVGSVMGAVEKFESGELKFGVGELRRNAERFNKQRFQQETMELVMGETSVFQNQEFAYSQNLI
jgi:glycosyltransferase involved in cell wall biosynthesis